MSTRNIIILVVGVVWACLTAAVEAVAVSAPHPSSIFSDTFLFTLRDHKPVKK